MEFIDWCHFVLGKIIEVVSLDIHARSMGVDDRLLLRAMYGDVWNQPHIWDGKPRAALLNAVKQLDNIRLIEEVNRGGYMKATRLGKAAAGDPTELWEAICALELEPDQEELIRVVNRLSPREDTEYSELEWVTHDQALSELNWLQGIDLLSPVADELKKRGFLGVRATIGPTVRMHATYKSLVWETRRGYTIESRRIDRFVQEWENTSRDFKRELTLKTKPEKAEFVKDILALANTQSPLPHSMIIGFDNKTRSYYGPPDPNVTQEQMEQILAQYTTPIVNVRYLGVDYRQGTVGEIDVLREPRKLPYKVAKSVGDKKARPPKWIEEGTIFVRHGTIVEEATPAELEALQTEGDRARETG